jgi:4-hydroxy-4-methyl-2-oxoglutarate aldolase
MTAYLSENDYVRELSEFPTALISDCLNRLQVLNPAIRPISTSASFCAPAFPVEEFAGLNSTLHLTVAMLPEQCVLMVNAFALEQRAVWGGMLNLAASARRVAAVVIDGAVRDSAELKQSPFPVYARAITSAGPLKGEIGKFNQTTSVGGVIVNPGDIVRGDEDGVVVVPLTMAEETILACYARAKKEREMVEYIHANGATKLGHSLLKDQGSPT